MLFIFAEITLFLRNGEEKNHLIDIGRDFEARFFFGLCPQSLEIEGSCSPLKVCSGEP